MKMMLVFKTKNCEKCGIVLHFCKSFFPSIIEV